MIRNTAHFLDVLEYFSSYRTERFDNNKTSRFIRVDGVETTGNDFKSKLLFSFRKIVFQFEIENTFSVGHSGRHTFSKIINASIV